MADPIKYEDKQCERFIESLDEEGEIEIAGISFLPSRILFDMEEETFITALSEFNAQEFEELKQTVYDYYPSMIAYNLRLSEKGQGASDPVRKLLHLKDTWEAVVFILYAVVWGEVRAKNINLQVAQVIVSYDTGGNPVFESFTSRRLLTDAIKLKTQNIKAVIEHSKANSLGLKCETIDTTLMDTLLQLQDIRNDLSHHTAPTREQAEKELLLVAPLFKEMLEKTKFLENCKIYRFENYDGTICQCEVFNDHSLNRQFEQISLTGTALASVLALGNDQLFVKWDTELFSLSPFLHFQPDTTGHEAYLCFYKRRHDSKFWFEPLKTRAETAFDPLQARFDSEKDTLQNLIVP